MLSYELAKKLKKAGFPQQGGGWWMSERKGGYYGVRIDEGDIYDPTLSELIEACGKNLQSLKHMIRNMVAGISCTGESYWMAVGGIDWADIIGEGKTPEEAVANLWLKLNER